VNRAASTSQAKVLDTIRRIEIAWLLVLSVTVAWAYQPAGFVAAFAMLAAALALVPQRHEAAATRDEARLELLNRIQTEGLELRARYVTIRETEPTYERSQALWQVVRELTVWLARSQDRLRRYPEFAGIFEFRRGNGGTIDEVDRSLAAFSELRRLSTLSQNLQLPI
jgi:hypothetical protein